MNNLNEENMGLDKGDLTGTEPTRDADRELDDFNAELSGTKSGYTYVTSAAASESRPNIRAKEARKAEARLSALEALLASDPEYRALYEDTQSKVNEAGTRAEASLDEAKTALAKAEQELIELEKNAARTPDGQLAFKGADGKVYDQDGNSIGGVEADSIVWPENAPTYEEYLAKNQAVAETRERVEALQQYLLLIGEARDRLDDPGDPMTNGELREWQRKLETQNPTFTETEPSEPEMPQESSFMVQADKPVF